MALPPRRRRGIAAVGGWARKGFAPRTSAFAGRRAGSITPWEQEMVRHTGAAPALSVWKTDVLAVAFKIGRGQGGFAGASPLRAVTAKPTQPPAYFQCNPKGCGSFSIFPRCSLGQDRSGYCRFARALKNRKIADSSGQAIPVALHQRPKRMARRVGIAPT